MESLIWHAVIIGIQKEARLRNETLEAVDCLVHAVEYGIHVTSQVRDCLESIVSFVEFMIQSKSQYTITQDTNVLNNIRNTSLNDHIPSTKTHCKISLQSAQDTSSENDQFNKYFTKEKENDDHDINHSNRHSKITPTKHDFEQSTKFITQKNDKLVNQVKIHWSENVEKLSKDEDDVTYYEWDQTITSENIHDVLQSLKKFKCEKERNKEK